MVVEAVVHHWEYLLVAEREGGDISGNKVDGAQTAGRTIRDRDDRKKWEEEGHQWLMAKAYFSMPMMG